MAKFKKGQSGNPNGRPKGILDRRSKYRSLIEKHVPDVVGQVVSAALGGDMTACKLLLDKVVPSIRPTAPVLPALPKRGSAVLQSEVVVESMLDGSLPPDQAATAIAVLVDHARLYEHAEIEARLEQLESRINDTTN